MIYILTRLDCTVPVQPAQLSILASLATPQEVRELAEANGLPHRTAHQAVEVLEAQGLVTSHRRGRERVVTAASKALPTLARGLLFDVPREDWGRVLHGDRPTQLHVLDRVGNAALAAEVCGKARRTLYHTVEQLAPAGVLVKPGGLWRINPRLGPLRDFVAELARVQAHHRASQLDPRCTVTWHLGPEIFVKSRAELSGPSIHRAGLSAFAAHGVELITGASTYYYVATRRLDAADAILQGLLTDPGSTVNRSYCALVYEKVKPAGFLRKARIYGLKEEADALVRYVETHEASTGFLPWSAHERYRRQYGVN